MNGHIFANGVCVNCKMPLDAYIHQTVPWMETAGATRPDSCSEWNLKRKALLERLQNNPSTVYS